ncbi:uncharacterized protein CC84DRAFT_267945 [Paraphaeosphaeria sporulosa]|uniref:Uncharacterized protein n=1 Tax=Paraphaeosphaeria sporulosa TaxID=1460663 RepID=A0A177C221_9PLEO|nr:uncharacterized protein CC84DRAFT_267945 [Paraphaeosphaeria sporulosa]OAG00858.1 hypothetical protein CC84DRAFT_267945 [Paraphaeosphaeria sporulosa]
MLFSAKRYQSRLRELTCYHVVQEELIRMSSLQLRLPSMVMGVNEPGADDLIRTIDNLGSDGRCNGFRNPHNLSVLYEDVCFGWHDLVICVVDKSSSVLENDALLSHHCQPQCSTSCKTWVISLYSTASSLLRTMHIISRHVIESRFC